MARVAMSNAIVRTIENKISTKFSAKKEAITKQYATPDLAYKLRDEVRPQEVMTFAAKFPEYIQHGETVHIRRKNGDFALTIAGLSNFPLKVDRGGYYSNAKTTISAPPGGAVDQVLLQCQAELAAVDAEQRALMASVNKLLTSAPSLNRVAEVWPSVLEYVDDATRERFNAPDVPRKTKRSMAQLDEDAQVTLVKLNIQQDPSAQ